VPAARAATRVQLERARALTASVALPARAGFPPTHALLNEPALERIASSGIQENLFAELYYFFSTNKRWWLIPIVVVLLFMGFFLLLSSTAAAPFIYTIF
jgi:hypothetical protein